MSGYPPYPPPTDPYSQPYQQPSQPYPPYAAPSQPYPPPQQYPPQQYPPRTESTQGYPPQQQQQQQYSQPPPYSSAGTKNDYPQRTDSYNPTASGNGTGGSSNLPSSASKFNNKPHFQDIWASILFFLHLVAFVAVAGYSLKDFRIDSTNNGVVVDDGKLAGMVFLTCFVGLILSTLYFLAMQKFAGKMIVISFWINVLISIASTVIMFIYGQYLTAIISAVFTVLLIMCWFWWKTRIPFAKVMLKTVCSITSKYPATLFMGFIGTVFSFGYFAFFFFAIIAAAAKFGNSTGSIAAISVFFAFSLYWTSQVLKNWVHVTVSGVFATYYFFGVSQNGVVQVPVSNPTWASMKRASTTSFGSICFGSLIIALIQTVRAVLRGAANDAASDGNLIGAFCLCCLECIISWIEALVEYFNHYAFTQVAIYGKAYCDAAKSTWKLVKSHGLEAVINDSLIGNVLGLGGLVVGIITGVIAGVYGGHSGWITNTDLNTTALGAVCGAVGFLIGLMEFYILAEVINSGVATTFVCIAEDPAAMQRTKPELYQKIREVYPMVML